MSPQTKAANFGIDSGGTVSTEDGDRFTRIVQEAEAGEPIQMTRHGKPVAVALSQKDSQHLTSPPAEQQELAELWTFVDHLMQNLIFPCEQGFQNLSVSLRD